MTLAATAAKVRARQAHRRMTQSGDRPVVALMIAVLQTAAGLGDITAVAEAVPALGKLADALGWTSLMLPLPSKVSQLR